MVKAQPLRPPKLVEGDEVAVVSPSWGGPSIFPRVYELGLRNLELELGLRVREMPHTRLAADELYADPRLRADDINGAFAEPTVKAVLASIGGDDSVRVLPHLDIDLIRANPKVVMGFSDTTTISTYLSQCGLVTFNGPSVMAGFAQMRQFGADWKSHVQNILFSGSAPYEYVPFSRMAEGYPDWGSEKGEGGVHWKRGVDLTWHWLQGSGRATGGLFGGCLEVLEFMKGTAYWPPVEFWNDKILCLETSEEIPSVQAVKRMLRNYGSQGVLDRIRGMLWGRARGYSSQMKKELDQAILAVVAVEFGRPDLPLVTNLDFGHTDPQFILPLGVAFEIDAEKRRLRLMEAAVS